MSVGALLGEQIDGSWQGYRQCGSVLLRKGRGADNQMAEAAEGSGNQN